MALDRPKRGVRKFSEARTSHWFVIGLAVWITTWVGLNYLPGPWWHFDITEVGDRFGLLNFLLSIEATLSMPFLFMTQAWDAAEDRKRIDELLHATRALVKAVQGIEEDIEELVDDA